MKQKHQYHKHHNKIMASAYFDEDIFKSDIMYLISVNNTLKPQERVKNLTNLYNLMIAKFEYIYDHSPDVKWKEYCSTVLKKTKELEYQCELFTNIPLKSVCKFRNVCRETRSLMLKCLKKRANETAHGAQTGHGRPRRNIPKVDYRNM
jgi:hypothetical protein